VLVGAIVVIVVDALLFATGTIGANTSTVKVELQKVLEVWNLLHAKMPRRFLLQRRAFNVEVAHAAIGVFQ
jgi:hypothetical protein